MKHFILICLICAVGYAQTLDALIEAAKEKNPALAAASHAAEAKALEIALAGKLENPMLSLGINDILSSDLYARDVEPMQTQSLVISQKFPLSGKLGSAERLALHGAQLSRLLHTKETASLVYEIKTAVYRLKKLENDLRIIARYRTILDEMIRMHTLYNIESRTHYQMTLKTEILKTGIRLRQTRVQSAIAVLKARLERLTGLAVDDVEHTLGLPSLPSLTHLIERAEENIEWQIKAKERDASQEAVTYAKAGEVPDITVGAGYFQREAFDDYYSFSVTIPLTLYDRENIAVARNLKLRDAKEAALADWKNRLQSDLKEAHLNLRRAHEEYRLQEAIIASLRDIAASLINRIESKQSTLQDGYEVIREIIDSEFSLNDTMLEANLYGASLDLLQGVTQ
jgi:outer membrane protein TolC